VRKAILIILLLPFLVAWTQEDTKYQTAFIATALVDWGQTLYIASNPDEYKESNVLLGDHPSRDKVNMYFPIAIGLHTAVAVALPKDYRRVWQLIWIGIETGMIVHNASIGIKVDF
jgi:hypothetical protein